MIWRIAKYPMPCGSCRAPIAKGAPFGEITLGSTRRSRCYDCACMFVGFCPFVVEEPATEPPVSWQPLLPDSLPGRAGASVDVRAQLGQLRDRIFGAPA